MIEPAIAYLLARRKFRGMNLLDAAVMLPLISANIVAGAILVFSFAMLEVSESLILAVKEQYYPITKAIYQLMARIEDGPFMASALGVWSMAFLAISFLAAGVLLGRRMGQLFRV